MNTLRNETITKHVPYLEHLRNLYDRNFPDDERIPFDRLCRQLSSTKIMHAWFHGNTFIGMTVIFLHQDLVYLAYLVVDETQRRKGYGSLILESLRKQYPDHRFVIDIEEVIADAPDVEIRQKRRAFYIRSGYQATGVFYRFYNVDYELLSYGGLVLAKEYHRLILVHWGPIANTAIYRKK